MEYDIYLSPPNMGGLERQLVNQAFDSNWIAPSGPALAAFEAEAARYVGVSSALAVASGTAAIHLALRWLGVGPGDLVFCSDFTFAATCNPILYQGATPVFIDSEPDTWNMSPQALERALRWADGQGWLPKAVVIVDLFGESADWASLLPLCRRYGVPVVEDAAEALGSEYRGSRCGSFGDVAILSFNGNKIITSSGGGMVLSNNGAAVDKMRFWSTQAREPVVHYEHKEFGFNYRMSNICAAIGLGQMAFLPEKIARRRRIRERYRLGLAGLPGYIKGRAAGSDPNCWLSVLVVDEGGDPFAIGERLRAARVETRPVWKPMHMQPLYKDAICFAHGEEGFVSEDAFRRSLCLPSGDGLRAEEQTFVLSLVRESLLGLPVEASAPAVRA